jgi:hypothetical protein
MAAAGPSLVTLSGPQPTTAIVSFSVAASAPANSIVAGSIANAFGPLVPATETIQVPITERWDIVDMWTQGVQTPDATPIITVNGYPQVVSSDFNSMNQNVLTRFRLTTSIVLVPGASVSISAATLQANGTSAVTLVLYVKIRRSPFGA